MSQKTANNYIGLIKNWKRIFCHLSEKLTGKGLIKKLIEASLEGEIENV